MPEEVRKFTQVVSGQASDVERIELDVASSPHQALRDLQLIELILRSKSTSSYLRVKLADVLFFAGGERDAELLDVSDLPQLETP